MPAPRSGTEKRQRQEKVSTRLTPQELDQIRANAQSNGMTVAELLRTSALAAAAS